MNWRRAINRLVGGAIVACLIAPPVLLMSEGASFWDAVSGGLAGTYLLLITMFIVVGSYRHGRPTSIRKSCGQAGSPLKGQQSVGSNVGNQIRTLPKPERACA